ncbi:MAG: response regulator [Bacteroidetes bacterium]|nr:response regulator [Bacteroidota bacterium]
MSEQHPLLNRQIRKYLDNDPQLIEKIGGFLSAVQSAYEQADSDRKMLERSLELSSGELVKSNTELRAIFRAFPDMFFLVNGSGIIIEHRGGSPEDLYDPDLNLSGRSIFSGPDQLVGERFMAIFNKVRETNTIQSLEYSLHIHNSNKYYEARFVPLESGNTIIIIRNITEKKKLEAQFLRTQRMESIGTLAGGIAHDLNNVFAPLMLSVDLLRTRVTDEKSVKIIGTIEESLRRGADMIRQVLAFARGVEGNHRVLDPKRIIQDVLKIAEDTFPKQIRLQSEIAGDLPMVRGDETQLHQVILNICVNARDVMPVGGTLRIQARTLHLTNPPIDSVMKVGEFVVISISDTGAGIPASIIDKIFEPFFTTKDVGKGTGLGLSTALSIMRSHGGHINVYSIEGRGTTFTVYVPVAGQVVSEQTPPTPSAIEHGNGEWILIIDDEAPIRMIAEQTLVVYNYKVITAANGYEGIQMFKQHQDKISLVISDMMMPEMDGIETVHHIRRMSSTVPILGTSGLSSYSQVSDLTGPATSFLSKPYSGYELLTEVRRMIDESLISGS